MNEVVSEVAALRAVIMAENRYIEKTNRRPTHCVMPQKVYDHLVELNAQANRQLNPSANAPENENDFMTVNGCIVIPSPYIGTVVVFEEIIDGVLLDNGGGAE